MFEDFIWIYLLFFLIPLVRIIPRFLRKMKNYGTNQTLQGGQFELRSDNTVQKSPRELSRPQTKDILVLGELCRGTKTFENVKKNTGLESSELNSILEDLEKQELIRVEQKSGFLGPKVELYTTEKGFRKYQS
ncbi:MAG: hypothetical protein ACREAX_00140 [Candidatus Nitrosotenuis sp.]